MSKLEVCRYLELLSRRPEFDKITGEDFQAFLEAYGQHVSNPMQDLDKSRFETIPEACQGRNPMYLKQSELIRLVNWVYLAGHRLVNRPHFRIPVAAASNIKRLKRNRASKVVTVTREAFRIYAKDKDYQRAIHRLTFLQGVGLGTATLILSTAYSDDLPFFSDALCNWMEVEYNRKDIKGYSRLLEGVNTVRRLVQSSPSGHFRVTVLDIEKVAFVVASSQRMQERRLPEPSLQFELQKHLGDGGQSVAVFAAQKTDSRNLLPARFAVKVVSGLKFRLRYLRMLKELTILGQLAERPSVRDNFAHFYGWMFLHGHFFITMQLMQCDLETYLQEDSGCYAREVTWAHRQPYEPLQKPIAQLIAGLSALHKAGFTHRDLRPKNILLDGDGSLKIGDFGISKHVIDGLKTKIIDVPEIWGYSAPEIIKAEASPLQTYSPKVDIWSLGCIVYRMLMGERLFTNLDDVRRNHGSKVESLKSITCKRGDVTKLDVNFLQCLLCEEQERRMNADEARQHSWFSAFDASC